MVPEGGTLPFQRTGAERPALGRRALPEVAGTELGMTVAGPGSSVTARDLIVDGCRASRSQGAEAVALSFVFARMPMCP